ncbi:MAG TPA: hypothetical protein VKH43_02140 [Thermoanaerobaculia bacterium]|nr:hypothetical protein [Thermoanaerobaculia bacterium]
MRRILLALCLAVAWISFSTALLAGSAPTPVLYGGNGGHGGGVTDGLVIKIDQTTAAVTNVGHPDSVKRITGLAFDSAGNLWGSTLGGAPGPPPPAFSTSKLIQINPTNGSQISSVDITDGPSGPAISIADLAIQPCTDVIYAVRGPQDGGGPGNLYTVDKGTGVATLVINTGHFFGSIAFGPDGTLYMAAADLDKFDNQVGFALETRDPASGTLQSSVPTAQFYGALAVRPTDGKIFAGNGDFAQIFTLDPSTGAETLIGSTGSNFVGDLAFRPTSSPTSGLNLNCLSPAELWIGLKNSDDVGTKFDLRAEVTFNNNVIGSGELDSVNGGSSGFNNARERGIPLTLTSNPTLQPADTVCLVPSVRIATKIAGHRSGTARLWYNDSAANSRLDIRLGTSDSNLFLIDFNGNSLLSLAPGSGPKKTSDVFVDKLKDGNAWKPFGKWCVTID